MNILGFIWILAYLAPVAFIVYILVRVTSALNRISGSVEDIAQTLRRMESKEPQSNVNL
jgi:uncharacterized protein YoxC